MTYDRYLHQHKGLKHMKTRNLRRIGALSILCAATVPAVGLAAEGRACSALSTFKLAGHNVEITSAVEVPAGPMAARPGGPPAPPVNLPAHCRVDGVIDRRVGRDGKPYAIGFAVALPANWNGRFFYQGGGGLNGVLNPPVGAQYAGDAPALSQGFAIASTDSGHLGTGFDASFMLDQEALLNFLYQANAKVTIVAKELVAAHYGRPAHHAYWVGCSTGGREGMIMSQRFPNLFDGIVAGAPAMRTNYSNLALRWMATQLNAIAPKDAQGRPQTNRALSDADRKLVVDSFVASCDALTARRMASCSRRRDVRSIRRRWCARATRPKAASAPPRPKPSAPAWRVRETASGHRSTPASCTTRALRIPAACRSARWLP